jgi:hypothetical protein
MALLGRLLIILLGYVAADLVAAAVLISGELMAISASGIFRFDTDLFALIGIGFLTISGYLLLPVLIALAITEALGVRRAIAYAVLGGIGAIGLACYLGLSPLNTGAPRFPALVATGIMACAGSLAGLTYWKIAGHNAGAWRARPAAAAAHEV